ncbi:MAG: IS4 family transposase, partial [Planctomycetota bacterium]
SLGGSLRWDLAELPHSTSMTQARDRLGWKTVRLVFRKLADLLCKQHAPAFEWRSLPVYALDGTSFKAADTEANEAAFGRPGASRGKSGFPQLRAIVLMGAWTHLIAEVVLGPWSVGETKLAADYLLNRLKANTLILMDRAYFAYGWLVGLHAKGTFFVVRVKTGPRALKLKKRKRLGPGEYLGRLLCPPYLRNQRKDLPEFLEVRIVTYQRKGYRPVTVVTNLLDRVAYPAREVGALYHDRWEVELGYRELKIHLGEERVLFRSKKPERVLQEAYGLFLAYNCVRALMAEAAAEVGVEP